MINKKNIWFLTLFSLILVLSVYYVTMPSDLLLTNGINLNDDVKVTIKESNILSALRLEDDSKLEEELDSLKLILNDSKSSVDEKNKAFDKMKDLNINKSKETDIENILKEKLKLETFVKIKDNQIKVIVNTKEHDTNLANTIMKTVQKNFDTKKYITVEFKN